MAQSRRSLKKANERGRMEISGATGLASGWSEWTSTSDPSEPLASLTSPLNKTACLGLNCETAFYRPARQKGGFYKLAQHWLVAGKKSTDNKLSKTIQGTMLHKTARPRAWQACGSWERLDSLRVEHLSKGASIHTTGFDCQSEATKELP